MSLKYVQRLLNYRIAETAWKFDLILLEGTLVYCNI